MHPFRRPIFVALTNALLVVALFACGPNARGDGGDPGDPGCETGDGVACDDPCAGAKREHGYIGCEYWPVDLLNGIDIWGDAALGCSQPSTVFTADVCVGPLGVIFGLCDHAGGCAYPSSSCATRDVCGLDAQHSKYAVVVANPDENSAVSVTLENRAGHRYTESVEPGAVVSLFPQSLGFPDQSTAFAGLDGNAYRLTSSRPIVAYQFNPLDNVGVFSNDASLLIPGHAFDKSYLAVSYWSDVFSGYATIVGSEVGSTTVTVRASTDLDAGRGMSSVASGATATFTIEQFETLTLKASTGGDLTGTEITADRPIGVYGGHEATPVSAGVTGCYADHLEEQLFPVATWGKRFAIARTVPRRGAPDMLRVLALRAGTQARLSGAAGTCGPLDAGEHCDLFVREDLEVEASEPVLVAKYLVSVGETFEDSCDSDVDPLPPGDPALALVSPVEQFRDSYTFLIPMAYSEHHVSVVVPEGGGAILDGRDLDPLLEPFGSGAHRAARVAVDEGAHRLECDDGCGVEVYGWDETVSYLFAGGLDLQPIVVE